MNKKLFLCAMAALVMTNAFPAFNANAAETAKESVSAVMTQTDEIEQNVSGKLVSPGWYWIGDYCYYIESDGYLTWQDGYFGSTASYEGGKIFKNGNTPDGYTVDKDGRWTVNGVPQTKGLGFWKSETSYKDWNDLRENLKNIWSDQYTFLGSYSFHPVNNNEIQGNASEGSYNSGFIAKTDGKNVQVRLQKTWSDMMPISSGRIYELAAIGNADAMQEKTLKTVLGNKEGQTVYNYVKAYVGGNRGDDTKVKFEKFGNDKMYTLHYLVNENGTWYEADDQLNTIDVIYPQAEKIEAQIAVPDEKDRVHYTVNGKEGIVVSETETVESSMGVKGMDVSNFQNRTTDFGQKYSLSVQTDAYGDSYLWINVEL